MSTTLPSISEEMEDIHEGFNSVQMMIMTTLYLVIFFAGTVGNVLVILVILKFPQMRSVTNMYLFNLAISDFLYLWGIPFTLATAYFKEWVFGAVTCKLFYILTSLNWFASVFTITVLSADRYLAVCWATASLRYRNGKVTKMVCTMIWLLSILVSLPILIYATTQETRESLDSTDGNNSLMYCDRDHNSSISCYSNHINHVSLTSSLPPQVNGSALNKSYEVFISCTITWTLNDDMTNEKAFILYAFFLSFALPVPLVSVFYILVIIKLARTGRNNKGASQVKRSKRKVTVMVMSVITAYVVCWLPYWVMQIIMIFVDISMVLLFNFLTVLNYANSALNPLLYAFLSETFRKNFAQLFGCRRLTPTLATAVTT